MRSGSSLLHHLLQTNSSILGAGESNRVYRSAADLRRFGVWAHAKRRSLLNWRLYVADQINHTDKLPEASLLSRSDVKTIILIREPHATIASLVKMTHHFYESKWSEHNVINYYLERIEALSALAETLKRSAEPSPLLLTYDELVNNTFASLGALQRFLELTELLSATYETFDFTGRRGDPSQRIKAKAILTAQTHRDYALPVERRNEIGERYGRAFDSLRSTCLSALDTR
jgi:hypothetical protein